MGIIIELKIEGILDILFGGRVDDFEVAGIFAVLLLIERPAACKRTLIWFTHYVWRYGEVEML